MIFFEWVCSGGFQIDGDTNDHRWVCSSLIFDRRAGFGGWIGWVDRWVDRFETVDLLIGGWIGCVDWWVDRFETVDLLIGGWIGWKDHW